MHRWMIRNSSGKLLGPISKKMIIDLLQKKLLRDDDEVGVANGHWFYIWEKDLIEKYLYGEMEPEFNPTSATRSVLLQDKEELNTKGSGESFKTMVININDAIYQDKEEEGKNRFENIINSSVSTSLDKNNNNAEQGPLYPSADDLAYPSPIEKDHSSHLELDSSVQTTSKIVIPLVPAGMKKNNQGEREKDKVKSPTAPSVTAPRKEATNKKDLKNLRTKDDRFLFWILYSMLAALIIVLYKLLFSS